jgi:hypothetical protein
MGNRGIQAALVVVVIVFGVLAALIVGNARKGQVANTNTTPAASASATESPSPSPSPSASAIASPSPEASPSVAPSESPSAAPAPTATTQPAPTGGGTGPTAGCSTSGTGGNGPATYPRQIQAGAQYQYCGSRVLIVHATDNSDTGTGFCAGINENTQAFPSGDQAVFFIGVEFPDHQILAAGYIRRNGARTDFASIQQANGTDQAGTVGSDPGPGSHTYCIAHSAPGVWHMDDLDAAGGRHEIYATTREPATDLSGATLKFDSNVEAAPGSSASPTTLVVPGFHDILIDGRPPTKLTGATFYS